MIGRQMVRWSCTRCGWQQLREPPSGPPQLQGGRMGCQDCGSTRLSVDLVPANLPRCRVCGRFITEQAPRPADSRNP